ncbi:MAG: NADH-quinone oxidoreductase subunit L, partial [Sediminibacterium sp.]|nr:NADH-quinone oxidoreductase subunit L [Sediminibacterium sp.]
MKAAKKAFIMNRIGDAAFLLAIFWIILKIHSVDFDIVLSNQSISLLSKQDITAITVLFFIGATGKSAQIPLFTWLPDAMAGPTPVSALIHAATMVTAGIYLIVRSNILFQLAPFTNHIILIIGTCTMLLAASIALKQKDIKKILAYSTVSQLGYMFIALGLGAYSSAVFHVITHAFFKALLFLGAGSIIFSLHHEQNIFNMGGLKKLLPITHITFLVGCLAIAGIPPFSGFFSKDQILMAMFNHSPIFYAIGLLGALMTAFYMFRLYFLVFYGEYKNHHYEIQKVKEHSTPIKFTLIVLAIGSLFAGILGIPPILGGTDFLHNYLSPIINYSTENIISHNTEIVLMTISCIAVLMVIFITRFKYIKNQTEQKMNRLELFLYNKWYIDELYDFAIVKPTYWKANMYNQIIENKIIDGGIRGIMQFINYSSRKLRLLQSGYVTNYLIISILTIYIFLIIWFNENTII